MKVGKQPAIQEDRFGDRDAAAGKELLVGSVLATAMPLRFIDELQGDPIGMFMNMLEAHGDICEVKVGSSRPTTRFQRTRLPAST